MYVGRIVAIGMNQAGNTFAMYRVSSRSFPNREARINNGTVSIMPRKGFEDDLSKNPYIAYNCIRIAGDNAIATNGSHTDPVTEKILAGLPPRDALSLALLAMDYEKDSLDTPRIAAVASKADEKGYLGIVRKDALLVKEFILKPGTAYYVTTYERNAPCRNNVDEKFHASSAQDACTYVMKGGAFADFEKPVTAAVAMSCGKKFEIAVSLE
jgi:IMP cyclohydrolase